MTTPSPRPLLFGPGSVIGVEYTIIAPLDEGGMGAVYIAEQASTGKRRAVKLMHREIVADAAQRRRFEQEARAGARIRSEHVVEVLAAGVDEPTGLPYLVMELLEGEDARHRLDRVGALPHDEVALVFEQLCHAMAAAHEAGVVHRDLKPENVFLARSRRADSAPFTVKVLDFGIAKIEAEAGTRATKGAVGSPLWMAPEQTAPGPITPAADVWALGLLAYELLTARTFWRAANQDGGTTAQLLREIVLDPIPSASARAVEQGQGHRLPAGFDAWFARCVDRDPERRFAEAGEAWRAMRGLFGDARRSATRDELAATFVAPSGGEGSVASMLASETGTATSFPTITGAGANADGSVANVRSAPPGARASAADDAPKSGGPKSGAPKSGGPKSGGPKLPAETPLTSVNEAARPRPAEARGRWPLVVGALVALAGIGGGLVVARRGSGHDASSGEGSAGRASSATPPSSGEGSAGRASSAPPPSSVAPLLSASAAPLLVVASATATTPTTAAALASSAPARASASAAPALASSPPASASAVPALASTSAAPGLAPASVASAPATSAAASSTPVKRAVPGGFSDPTDRGSAVTWKVQDRHVRLFTRLVANESNVNDAVVRKAIEWSSWEYLRCYEHAFRSAKDMPEGVVTVGFDILDQLPRHAALVSSTVASATFNNCVVRTLVGQTINAAGPDGRGHVVYAFRFVPN